LLHSRDLHKLAAFLYRDESRLEAMFQNYVTPEAVISIASSSSSSVVVVVVVVGGGGGGGATASVAGTAAANVILNPTPIYYFIRSSDRRKLCVNFNSCDRSFKLFAATIIGVHKPRCGRKLNSKYIPFIF
jgi:hypothetical protein